ncbi:MAG: purine-binding chemotaxis protein CheW [Planctomycetes bacterium]|nr:purine-binding chemotaxis protein CheW [Planctomycetota bacterium]
MTHENQFCTFHLGDHYFGVEVQHVQEVIRHLELTPVPLAEPCVRGLINLRGQIVTAIDLREKLGMPPRSADESPINVVVRADGGPIACLVDRIGDVVTVREGFEEPPATVQGIGRELLRGAYKLEGRLLLVLDIERALGEAPVPA